MVVATVAGVFGLAGTGLGAWASLQAKRIENRSAREIKELESQLQETRDIRAEGRSKQERAKELVSRYREPLLSAAFELQSKIYNIVEQRFVRANWERFRDYAKDHTIYVFGQYLGWREIIRQEIQFLDLGDTAASGSLSYLLEEVTHALSTDRLSPEFMLFRGEQRAIGEKMLEPVSGATEATVRHQCLGYAAFVESLRRPDFGIWLKRLASDVEALATSPDPDYARLSLLQNALVDLIENLDTTRTRFPEYLLRRLYLSKTLAPLRNRATAATSINRNGAHEHLSTETKQR